MLTLEYVIRLHDDLWEVRLDGRLVSGQPTRREALNVANDLAHGAALRGQQSKIVVAIMDGATLQFPTIEAEAHHPA